MATLRDRWGLPLLAKELVEQSARRRTYVVRTLYACGLFLFAMMVLYDEIYEHAHDPVNVLGRGRGVFDKLVALQLGGIYVFMPALACGVITLEKERNSLGLLFLTKLGPWTIILEKCLGRLVPMLGCVLMTLPLIAFTYALGGLSAADVWTAAWLLALTALQVTAFSVMCSCFFRTTAAAFVATYVLGFLCYFGLAIAFVMSWEIFSVRRSRLSFLVDTANALLEPISGVSQLIDYPEEVLSMHIPPVMLFGHGDTTLRLVAARSLVPLISTVLMLCLARAFLVRRAFAPAKNLLLALFKRLDVLFNRVNHNPLTRGIKLFDDQVALPENEPVTWRETQKKSLGTMRYQVRVLVVLQLPVVAFCLYLAARGWSARSAMEAMSVVIILLWFLAVLLIAVTATNLFAAERTRQTLDVLLTTPLATRELIDHKLKGVRRMLLVLAVPFATVILFQTWWRIDKYSLFGSGENSAALYSFSSAATVAIYLPMVAWLSTLIGLRTRTQGRAIIVSLAVIVGWCVLPLVLMIPYEVVVNLQRQDPAGYLMLLSPATIIPFTEFNELDNFSPRPWTPAVLNTIWYAGCLVAIRNRCLLKADRYLGRLDG